MLNAFDTITIYIYTYIQRYYPSELTNALTQDIISDIKDSVDPKHQLHV
jgi:hypothetical protein